MNCRKRIFRTYKQKHSGSGRIRKYTYFSMIDYNGIQTFSTILFNKKGWPTHKSGVGGKMRYFTIVSQHPIVNFMWPGGSVI